MKNKMNYLLFNTMLIVLISSCGKYKDKEIVQTDSSGNILSTNDSNDWQNQNYLSDPLYDRMLVTLCQNISNNFFQDTSAASIIGDCTINGEICNDAENNFSTLLYPNPASKNTGASLLIQSSKKMLAITVGGLVKGQNEFSARAAFQPKNQNEQHEIVIPIDHSMFTLSYNKKDFELYVSIMTEDSCFNFTKGKIKWK